MILVEVLKEIILKNFERIWVFKTNTKSIKHTTRLITEKALSLWHRCHIMSMLNIPHVLYGHSGSSTNKKWLPWNNPSVESQERGIKHQPINKSCWFTWIFQFTQVNMPFAFDIHVYMIKKKLNDRLLIRNIFLFIWSFFTMCTIFCMKAIYEFQYICIK